MQQPPSKFQYAYWRDDKPKEEGFSHELISTDTAKILDRTTLDSLEALPYEGVDTILKGFKRNVERIPNHETTCLEPGLATSTNGKLGLKLTIKPSTSLTLWTISTSLQILRPRVRHIDSQESNLKTEPSGKLHILLTCTNL